MPSLLLDRGSLLGGPKELLLGQRATSIQIDLQEEPGMMDDYSVG